MFSPRLHKLFAALCLSLWLSLASSTAASAQEKTSPEKRALIRELLQLTNAGEVAQSISNAMLTQLESNSSSMLSQAIGEPTSAEAEQKYKELTQKFMQRLREELPKRINFAQVIEQLSLPLYDRLFTESELKDLITFYRSPTGQKAIKTLPQVFQETMQEADKIITPPITALITDLLEEIKKEASKTSSAPPAKAGKPDSPAPKKP